MSSYAEALREVCCCNLDSVNFLLGAILRNSQIRVKGKKMQLEWFKLLIDVEPQKFLNYLNIYTGQISENRK